MSNQDPNNRKFTVADGVSLRDYIESRLRAMDKAVEAAHRTLNTRLEGMNEFRNTLRDQASQFLKRSECDIARERILSDIKILNAAKDRLTGKASQQAVLLSLAIAGTALLLSAIGIMLRLMKV